MSEARRAIREGLRQLVHDPASWPPSDVGRFRNQLLDHCGSDARALATLLLRAREHGLVERLPAGPLPATRWEPVRRSLAHALALEAFLQPAWAEWAVDTWAVALGTVDPATADAVARAAERPRASTPGAAGGTGATPIPQRADPSSRPAAGWAAHVGAAPGWAASRNNPAGFAGGARPPGARPVFAASSILPQWVPYHRSNPSPVPLTGPFGMRVDPDRLWTIGFGALLLIVVVLAWLGVRATPAGGTLPADAPQRDATREDVAPRATSGETAPTREPAFGDLAPDSLAGTYRVRATLLEHSGARGCDAVARDVPWGAEQVETLRFEPGSRVFSFAGREGMRAVTGADGTFESLPSAGVRDGVAWRYVLRGRFTPQGFVARAETVTDVVVRWRRTRTCRVTSELVARRLDAAGMTR